jgi:hypothetical protein
VAFPGSNNVACWLADLDATTVTVDPLGALHAGFWNAWHEIADDVIAQPVDVAIGHSEGAALAILWAAQLCLAGRPPKEVFAFEPPRVTCDDTLANLFKANGVTLHLFRNGNDVVTQVPRLLEDWQHPGPLTAIGVPIHAFDNIDDHLMPRVIAALS